MVILTMTSAEYGEETFEYDTVDDAVNGQMRIEEKSRELNDGILRTFKITDEVEHEYQQYKDEVKDPVEFEEFTKYYNNGELFLIWE
ncbi:hypothetical protein [Spirosoma sordidisoli]|uniref:Uncharacterized protein n=1 Tax=Spirosoma sordidisoli TaxID=2502893 RepID=A0A4Q2UJE1_9BACT|nr:hypothetical protein [Spirosoma sordidisoli]RYC69603.1 hypothetical protein EQG79_13450 [Spirosoma sordidisoli]